jgi:LysM repeat protein
MGFMDKLKSMIGGDKESAVETVKGPSRVLREAGIDPSGLNCRIAGDGTLTVSGACASAEERDRVIEVLEGMPDISRVVNEITIGTAPKPAAGPAEAAEGALAAAAGQRRYTVQPGDTLWKISENMYGNGSKYMKIFEANTPMLEDPDKIFPGQELIIPDLED